jgi:hypothetical protein
MAANDSEWHTVTHSQFENGKTEWQIKWSKGFPRMVMPSSVPHVKSA